jgi:hypothetical protein
VTFKPWKPGGEVNIYEFFTSYEEWSTGLLSDREKAYRLYHLYLDTSLTSTYETKNGVQDSYLIGRKPTASTISIWTLP